MTRMIFAHRWMRCCTVSSGVVRIVFIAPFAYAPKATVSARMMPMAKALARRGHTVHILVPPYDNPAHSGVIWEEDGVRVINMRVRAGASGFATYASLARQLVQHVRQLKPEVLHVFKPVGVGALAMLALPPPFVDNDDWEGRGGWVDVNPYSPAQRLMMIWQERWALRRARAVTCASEALVMRTQVLRGRCDAVLMLPNGPDFQLRAQVAEAESRRAALRRAFGWDGNMPMLIYAGTVPRNHDLDVAVRALAELVDRPWRWVIIASGDGVSDLQAQITRLHLDARVEWHAFMPRAQLVERLVAADIALYPYRDTPINRAKCSGKVVDYMACGKPMVVSDVGMNRIYLDGGRCGMLTPPGDALAFRDALHYLLEHPHEALALGRAAQAYLWAHFDWSERVGALEALYAQHA
ncbi:MAG: glycosyltransferase family 4 protein [Thermoflexales bacterium]|nr:glycosyltransferase family 4 protein [Thermoflexales bacterium]